jgi:hypothetical protein
MEYALSRSNEFHFATAAIFSRCNTAPILDNLWFAAHCSASPSRVFAEFDEGMTQETYGILSFD